MSAQRESLRGWSLGSSAAVVLNGAASAVPARRATMSWPMVVKETCILASFERLGTCNKLPRHDGDTQDCAEDLPPLDGEPPGEEPRHVCTKGDGVAAEVGSKHGKQETERDEEDAGASAGGPVVIQNGVQQVPGVPVGLSPLALDGGGGGEAEEEDEDLAEEDAEALQQAGVARLLDVAGQVGLVDQHGRQRAHDDVDAAHEGPAERGAGGGLLAVGVGLVDVGHAGAAGHAPAEQAEAGDGHDDALDGEDVVDPGRVHPGEGELEQPDQEEGEELLGGDVGVGGEPVGPQVPRVAEYAAEAHAEEVAAVKGLDAEPDDADHGADEDEEVGSVHADDGTREDGTEGEASFWSWNHTYYPMWYFAPGRAMATTTMDANRAPRMHEIKACCQVRPTTMSEAATFHPVMPNMVENQYIGRLNQVQVLCSGGVGSRSMFDQPGSPMGGRPSSVPTGASSHETNVSLDWKGALTAVRLGVVIRAICRVEDLFMQ
ncbi:hypothetical protein PpBr36_02641 [Pyricularia pennisetigena]|uniref:hypothetical protein n=1 Tax=Pyricularia pennisetigena TaxID=1578925 RepID=UPI0011502B4F|nr:hypothetical protein PpBr36_02641 [Pyricularia pennisetigena]TLS30929.1 hypothetical protein PpBr36_02641 [Pyricularia pennisetigena]